MSDIEKFLQNYQPALQNTYQMYVAKSGIEKKDYLNLIKNKLQDSLQENNVSYTDKEDLYQQLFYITNEFAKTFFVNKKKSKYICPGCSFLGKTSILEDNYYLHCNSCKKELSDCRDTKLHKLYKAFSIHSKGGYKCNCCNRFIPNNNDKIGSCPYLDCAFFGDFSSLKKMKHPTLDVEIKIEDKLISYKKTSKVELLDKIIDSQSNLLSYKDVNFTVPHKLAVYQSFKKLLQQSPDEMVDYLLNNSRSGGFQHKVFQQYISILESSFPILVKKNKKSIRIDNLLDSNLCLFDGISNFESNIDKNTIHNCTQEFYIGGRQASYTKPYYIGKLLNIIRKDNKEPILHLVDSYSFNKIKLVCNLDKVPVIVTHLRVPPHYQMGGMVYVNRIRKMIVDEAKIHE